MPARAPAMSGSSGMATSSARFMPGSSLQRVQVFDVDAAALAEQDHEDRKPDGRFGSRDGQHEEHEDLPMDVVQIARERDEVEVRCEQQQLHAHEEQDDVLAIEEHAGD